MAKRSNVIEINGRKYDASTGELIKPPNSTTQKQNGANLDGFSKPAKKPESVLAPSEVKKEARRRAAHAQDVHKKASKSKTLVRSSTTKPTAKKEKKTSFRSKILTPATSITLGQPDAAKKEHAAVVSKDLEKSASSVKKSSKISKFYSGGDVTAAKNNQAVASVSKAKTPSKKEELIAAQMAKVDTASTTGKKQKKSKDGAIKKTAKKIKKSPKVTSIAATAVVALLLFGYVTYLNIPNMALRVAAVKAGFDANMPGYSPSGYSFAGPVAYSPGQITIQFDSNTDGREYNITQRQTSWDSKSLLDNFVKKEVASDSLYSTVYDRGLTVYIYNGSNASWVNGGVWYTVDGDSLLSSEQLLRIAASL